MAHRIEDVDIEEEEYDEKADEDFNPETAAAGDRDASSSSEEDDEGEDSATKSTNKAKVRVKRKAKETGELDSGDEATIQQRKKGRRKSERADDNDDGVDDSGGEGGHVRTRAQRLLGKQERKQKRVVGDGNVTLDVQRLWEDLSSMPLGRPPEASALNEDADMEAIANETENDDPSFINSKADNVDNADEGMVTIKRRIEYAGETTEIEEQVPRDSKAARDYLDHQQQNSINRPLHRPSIFEPNPAGLVKGVAPEKLRPRAPNRLDILVAAEKEKAKRLTTVQKSAMDWVGYVEKEGLREELDEYGKSKRGYLAREDFLGRVGMAAEGRGRDARMRG